MRVKIALTLYFSKEQNKNTMTAPSSPARLPQGAFRTISTARHDALGLGPGLSLARGRVHEALGNAADMFAVLIASRMSGPIFWIGLQREIETLNPAALQDFLDPARITLIAGVSRAEILWAAEQALRTPAAIIAEIGQGPDLRESRRLQIAAEESGAVGIMLINGRAQTSAAETRWECRQAGENQWAWICTKDKRGGGGAWRVSWEGEGDANGGRQTGAIHLAAATAA